MNEIDDAEGKIRTCDTFRHTSLANWLLDQARTPQQMLHGYSLKALCIISSNMQKKINHLRNMEKRRGCGRIKD